MLAKSYFKLLPRILIGQGLLGLSQFCLADGMKTVLLAQIESNVGLIGEPIDARICEDCTLTLGGAPGTFVCAIKRRSQKLFIQEHACVHSNNEPESDWTPAWMIYIYIVFFLFPYPCR